MLKKSLSAVLLALMMGATPSMAFNQAHLDQLITTKSCPGCDLSGARLVQANLRNANLSGANLSGANLLQADLSDADLTGANLNGASLFQANLSYTNLRDANLRNANLFQATAHYEAVERGFLCNTTWTNRTILNNNCP